MAVVFSIAAVQLEAERTGLWYNVDIPACSSCPNIQFPLKILEECRGRIASSWIVSHPFRPMTPAIPSAEEDSRRSATCDE